MISDPTRPSQWDTSALDRALAVLNRPGAGLDLAARAAAAAHCDRLTKPRGSLGRLEDLAIQLAAITGLCPPPVPEMATVAVFAADHGVWAEGVSPWPQEVTAQMVANFCAGGAAVNVLARCAGARVVVVDVGVAGDLSHLTDSGVPPADAGPLTPGVMARSLPQLLIRKIRPGTDNLAAGPAMTLDQARAAVAVGAEVAALAVAGGAQALVTGDMGIANTTASAAVIASITGGDPLALTGRGTGVDDDALGHKRDVVATAVARLTGRSGGTGREAHGGDQGIDPLLVLAEVGGLEIAALAGFALGGAAARVPVILDGVIALAGAVVAAAMVPVACDFWIAGHRSTEPAASAALGHLGLDPVIDLGLRLGEGTGACLALPVVVAAARILAEMATFDSAGVADKG
ncbi:MAG: nicotinate-nucleotide--dimethylbenzimidazole phosphoribosyltransferase [Acidimicrobiales bacterium]